MKKITPNKLLVILLLVVSLVFYIVQMYWFQKPRDTAFYFLQDLAFLPLQVVIVSLVLNRFISAREKRERLKKMNMAINAFFGEAGSELVLYLNKFVIPCEGTKSLSAIGGKWQDKDFDQAIKRIGEYKFNVDSRAGDIDELKRLLIGKRPFLLSMLENSNLLEHDTFTEMLWAVFHIMDELVARDSLEGLPGADLDHLSLDIKRAYHTLVVEWIHYLAHLKVDYPYLFSMAVRKNPFDDNRSVIFKE